jgi:hypothetical protein
LYLSRLSAYQPPKPSENTTTREAIKLGVRYGHGSKSQEKLLDKWINPTDKGQLIRSQGGMWGTVSRFSSNPDGCRAEATGNQTRNMKILRCNL